MGNILFHLIKMDIMEGFGKWQEKKVIFGQETKEWVLMTKN